MWRRGEYEAGTALGLTAPGTEADVRFTPQSGHSLTVSPMAAFDPKRTFPLLGRTNSPVMLPASEPKRGKLAKATAKPGLKK